MKAKTLLVAAAALAAATISSQAQVYSQNIVGYVNTVFPAGKLIMACNPLTTGNDVATNVMNSGTGVTGATKLYHWNGGGWDTYTYSGAQKKWLNGTVDVSNTLLSPGVGFFVGAVTAFTNTFVGSIPAAAGGGTVTNSLTPGYAPVASIIAYGGAVTNSTFNLTVAGASTIQVWDNVGQAYFPAYTYSGAKKTWLQGTATNVPTIGVGQAFFINSQTVTNWVQTLQ